MATDYSNNWCLTSNGAVNGGGSRNRAFDNPANNTRPMDGIRYGVNAGATNTSTLLNYSKAINLGTARDLCEIVVYFQTDNGLAPTDATTTTKAPGAGTVTVSNAVDNTVVGSFSGNLAVNRFTFPTITGAQVLSIGVSAAQGSYPTTSIELTEVEAYSPLIGPPPAPPAPPRRFSRIPLGALS